MTLFQLTTLTFFFFSFSLFLQGIGISILNWIESFFKKEQSFNWQEKLGLAWIIGLGLLGYLGIILGIISLFNIKTILIIFFLLLYPTIKGINSFFQEYRKDIFLAATKLKKSNLPLFLLTIVFLMATTLFLGALRPPIYPDELAYHIPDAQYLINTGQLPANLGGHYFYGNIPKLLEVIFAVGMMLSGYQMAHLFHLSFVFASLLFIIGLLKKHFSLNVALLSAILILAYDELVGNAITCYIDAATACLELVALLSAINWLFKKQAPYLIITGIIIGMALSIKYSAAPTLLFIGIILLIKFILDKDYREGRKLLPYLWFCLAIILFGSYFYLKNLIIYQNPFYPLYFGHQGVDELSYQGLLTAIQAFGPRTGWDFLKFPFKFFNYTQFLITLAFLLSPLVIFISKNRIFSTLLFAFSLFYFLYWFFFATHQTRFLMSAIISLMIVCSIIINQLKFKSLIYVLTIFFLINQFRSPGLSPITSAKYLIGNNLLHLDQASYVLSRQTEAAFLSKKMGCQYNIAKYLEEKKLTGSVIDNWSVWHDLNLGFYIKNNSFFPFEATTADRGKLGKLLDSQNLKFLYINTKAKDFHLSSADQLIIKYNGAKEATEDYLLKNHAELIFQAETCKLYKLKVE